MQDRSAGVKGPGKLRFSAQHELLKLRGRKALLTSARAANKQHRGRGLRVQMDDFLLCWGHSEGEVYH